MPASPGVSALVEAPALLLNSGAAVASEFPTDHQASCIERRHAFTVFACPVSYFRNIGICHGLADCLPVLGGDNLQS